MQVANKAVCCLSAAADHTYLLCPQVLSPVPSLPPPVPSLERSQPSPALFPVLFLVLCPAHSLPSPAPCPVPCPAQFPALAWPLFQSAPPLPCPSTAPCLVDRPLRSSPLATPPPACHRTPTQHPATAAQAQRQVVQAAASAAWQAPQTQPLEAEWAGVWVVAQAPWAAQVLWAAQVPQEPWAWVEAPALWAVLVLAQAWAAAEAVCWPVARQQHPARWAHLLAHSVPC